MTFIAPHYSKANKNAGVRFLRNDHYLIRAPWWLQALYPGCTWSVQAPGKKLYLSFDDGPNPECTAFILDQLKKYNAKATFFCIGQNVSNHPDLYQRILAEGHAVGNHTQHHLNGWKTSRQEYQNDILQAANYIDSQLFRPPYGRMKRKQLRMIRGEMGMQVVMWSVLAGDWDASISPERCYGRIIRKLKPGDILVLHDSEKAWDRMSFILPALLEEFTKKGYEFEKIGG